MIRELCEAYQQPASAFEDETLDQIYILAMKKDSLGGLTSSEVKTITPLEAERLGLIPPGSGSGESLVQRIKREKKEREQSSQSKPSSALRRRQEGRERRRQRRLAKQTKERKPSQDDNSDQGEKKES